MGIVWRTSARVSDWLPIERDNCLRTLGRHEHNTAIDRLTFRSHSPQGEGRELPPQGRTETATQGWDNLNFSP